MCARESAKGKEKIQRIICNMPFREPANNYLYGEEEKQVYVDTWEEALSLLNRKFGPGTRAAVLGDATISYFAD